MVDAFCLVHHWDYFAGIIKCCHYCHDMMMMTIMITLMTIWCYHDIQLNRLPMYAWFPHLLAPGNNHITSHHNYSQMISHNHWSQSPLITFQKERNSQHTLSSQFSQAVQSSNWEITNWSEYDSKYSVQAVPKSFQAFPAIDQNITQHVPFQALPASDWYQNDYYKSFH